MPILTKLSDFKYSVVRRLYEGKPTIEVIANFYEGTIATENELDKSTPQKPVPVTRYRRSKLLRTMKKIYDGDVNDGQIYLDLCAELAKDKTHTPLTDQL